MPVTQGWPFFDLAIRTERLELRVADDALLLALADLAASGVHDPGSQPFTTPWTDTPIDEFHRSFLQFHWRCRADLTARRWRLNFAVTADGELVGMQGASASDFPVLRSAETGSWLGLEHHGKGIGTEMRLAILTLLFDGLSADYATSAAAADNPASQGVSRKLGYVRNGFMLASARGEAKRHDRFVLHRDDWSRTRPDVDVEILNLGAILPILGLDP